MKGKRGGGRVWPWALAALIALCGLWAAGCSDSEGDDEEAPYGPPSKTTTYLFKRQNDDGTFSTFEAKIVGEKEIAGATYWRAQTGDMTSENKTGAELWMLPDYENETVVFAGGEGYSQTVALAPAGEPLVSGTLDEPITIETEPPVGETQTFSVSASGAFAGAAATVAAAGSYVLEDDDASVETGMGVIPGCRQFSAEATATNSDLLGADVEVTFTGQAWYHPQYGVVGALIKREPYPDIVFGLAGTMDLGEAGEGRHMIQSMGVVDVATPSFTLSTYDVNQEFDADKETHAKMLLELRWLDEELAKGDTQPTVAVNFGTVFGVFPHDLVEAPISFFHPAEKDMGYKYWIAYVDQAAKNEAENGIAYTITVTNSGGTGAVRVTARIIYTLYQP
ncbi:MAG: hypothetical protein C4523_01660 [Myxococcales bacterium]|nr:MAG: hypothetical protein C4523_01660 [Myxococcales bacterium]